MSSSCKQVLRRDGKIQTFPFYNMESEDNLDELVHLVFSKPPQQPKSIQLQLDDHCQDPDVIPYMFSDIAMRGARALFGIEDMMMLDCEMARLLNEYMQSMGVSMQITCNFTGEDPFQAPDRSAVKSVQVGFKWL